MCLVGVFNLYFYMVTVFVIKKLIIHCMYITFIDYNVNYFKNKCFLREIKGMYKGY